MSRIHLLAVSLLVLPLAGCFDSNSKNDDRGGRYDDRGGYNNSGNRGGGGGNKNWYYRESDLVRIGSVVANNKREQNDLLEVKGSQRFKGILFSVDRGDVSIEHIRVTFDNDEAFEPQTSARFRDGEQTRLIDLPGNNRDVKRVRVKYRSHTNDQSTIVVWGLPTNYRR